MMRIGAVSLIGVVALAWLLFGAAPAFDRGTPPTIRAIPGPVKHRPEGFKAAPQQHQAIEASVERIPNKVPTLDTILIRSQ